MTGGTGRGEDDGTLTCCVANKPRPNGPEERVRQKFARKLMTEYGYRAEDLELELKIKIGSHKPLQADIAIFRPGDSHEQFNAYIIVEVKASASDYQAAKLQLESYVSVCRNAVFGLVLAGEGPAEKRRCFQYFKWQADGKYEMREVGDIPHAQAPKQRFTRIGSPQLAATVTDPDGHTRPVPLHAPAPPPPAPGYPPVPAQGYPPAPGYHSVLVPSYGQHTGAPPAHVKPANPLRLLGFVVVFGVIVTGVALIGLIFLRSLDYPAPLPSSQIVPVAPAGSVRWTAIVHVPPEKFNGLLHAEPSFSAVVTGRAANGARVEVLDGYGSGKDWYRVRATVLDGSTVEGWMHTSILLRE